MVVRRAGLLAVLEGPEPSLADALLNARPDAIGETLAAAVADGSGPGSFAVAQIEGDDVTLYVRGDASVMASGIVIRHSGPSTMAEQRLQTPADGQLNVMLDSATIATAWTRLFHGVVAGAGGSFGTPAEATSAPPAESQPVSAPEPAAAPPPAAESAPVVEAPPDPGQEVPRPPDRSLSFLGGADAEAVSAPAPAPPPAAPVADEDATAETPSPVPPPPGPGVAPPPPAAVVAPAEDQAVAPADPAPAPDPGPVSIVEAPVSSRPAPVQVRGLRCQRDHLVHPNARLCPLCGDNMQNRSVVVNPDGSIGEFGPRPPLGVLILPDGRSFQISRTTVLGRQPDLDDDVMAGVADAVILDEPNVSRRHVKIILEDWDVFAVDLGSANGTALAPSGEAPARVAPDVRTPINSGATIYLGSTQLAFQPTSARP